MSLLSFALRLKDVSVLTPAFNEISNYLKEWNCPHCKAPLSNTAVKMIRAGNPITCPNCQKTITFFV